MQFNFIPNKIFPYVTRLYDDHIEFSKDTPDILISTCKKLNKEYKILLNYYSAHQFYKKASFYDKTKERFTGKKYRNIPIHLFQYLDFENEKILVYDKMSKNDKFYFNSYNNTFKVDIQYYKLKRYIIKTPENQKITLKEHIQMLFGKKCIKFY